MYISFLDTYMISMNVTRYSETIQEVSRTKQRSKESIVKKYQKFIDKFNNFVHFPNMMSSMTQSLPSYIIFNLLTSYRKHKGHKIFIF
jgi:hypothetical protein